MTLRSPPEELRAISRMLTALAGWFLALSPVVAASPTVAEDPVYTSTFSNLAVGGYDAVAYFTVGKAVKGRGDFEFEWNGATWRFTTAENLVAFKADPQAYAPQYGGYYTWAVAQGYAASADPMAWRIADGKVYLNYDQEVQERRAQDIPGNIKKADANWPKALD